MNAYKAAKSFATQVGTGEVKVKHEHESAPNANDVPF